MVKIELNKRRNGVRNKKKDNRGFAKKNGCLFLGAKCAFLPAEGANIQPIIGIVLCSKAINIMSKKMKECTKLNLRRSILTITLVDGTEEKFRMVKSFPVPSLNEEAKFLKEQNTKL